MNLLRSLLRHLRSLRYLHRGVRVLDYGTGNCVRIAGRHRSVTVRIFGNGCSVCIVPKARLERVAIYVGADCGRVTVAAKMTDSLVHVSGPEASILVGAETTFKGEIFATDPECHVVIGSDCMMGGGMSMRCGDGHAVYAADGGARLNLATHITVGNHVWACEGSLILKNVTVGDGAIIAARAVVTRDVLARAVVAGMPARLVRKGVRWAR